MPAQPEASLGDAVHFVAQHYRQLYPNTSVEQAIAATRSSLATEGPDALESWLASPHVSPESAAAHRAVLRADGSSVQAATEEVTRQDAADAAGGKYASGGRFAGDYEQTLERIDEVLDEQHTPSAAAIDEEVAGEDPSFCWGPNGEPQHWDEQAGAWVTAPDWDGVNIFEDDHDCELSCLGAAAAAAAAESDGGLGSLGDYDPEDDSVLVAEFLAVPDRYRADAEVDEA